MSLNYKYILINRALGELDFSRAKLARCMYSNGMCLIILCKYISIFHDTVDAVGPGVADVPVFEL